METVLGTELSEKMLFCFMNGTSGNRKPLFCFENVISKTEQKIFGQLSSRNSFHRLVLVKGTVPTNQFLSKELFEQFFSSFGLNF
jgi:hypothetical protein